MIARRFRFLCYMFEMMFSFCFRGVTGTGTGLGFRVSFDAQYVLCLVSSIARYSVCFMFGFEYLLILSMFYVLYQDIG